MILLPHPPKQLRLRLCCKAKEHLTFQKDKQKIDRMGTLPVWDLTQSCTYNRHCVNHGRAMQTMLGLVKATLTLTLGVYVKFEAWRTHYHSEQSAMS